MRIGLAKKMIQALSLGSGVMAVNDKRDNRSASQNELDDGSSFSLPML